MGFIAPKIRCVLGACSNDKVLALPAYGFPRLHAFSCEPAYFGAYLAFLLPWLTSLALEPSRKRWLWSGLLAYACLLAFCTMSQTVYAIAAAEIGAMLFLAAARDARLRAHIFKLGAVLAAALAATFVLYRGHAYDIRGLGFGRWLVSLHNDGVRDAGLKAALLVAWHHPLFGAGLGQVGFANAPYWEHWKLLPPTANPWSTTSMHANILVQAGVVGFLFWIAAWLWADLPAFMPVLKGAENADKTLLLALAAVGIGEILVLVAVLDFWCPGAWIYLGLAWGAALGTAF